MSYKKPHHDMTSIIVPMLSRVGVLCIGHITDPPVIWPMWSRGENGLDVNM